MYSSIYDTNVNPSTYTGSENIGIDEDDNAFKKRNIKIHDEIIIDPREDSAIFHLFSGADNQTIYQNAADTAQPITSLSTRSNALEPQ